MSEVDDSKPHLRRLFDGKMYELNGEMIAGRLADCGIVLDRETGASRKHARFSVVDQSVYVLDLGSLNGTLVNGALIADEVQLHSGDVVVFDENEYEILIPWQSSEPRVDPDLTVLASGEEIDNRALANSDSWFDDDEPLEAADSVAESEARAAEEAIAAQEFKAAEEARVAEVARAAEEARAASHAKAAEEARVESQARADEEARVASQARAAEEARAASQARADEEARVASQARAAEEARAASQARAAEEARAASQARAAEEARAASQARAVEEARAAKEARAAAQVRAAEEARAAAQARAADEARVAAEAKAAEDAERPRVFWSESAAVSDSNRTIFADAVMPGLSEALQLDLDSCAEPAIVVQTGNDSGTSLQLIGTQTEWSIGSSTERHLTVSDSGVSTNHAAIVREGSKWKVVDQMSLNGTFVNDHRTNIRFINSGDRLRFGPVECLFVVPEGYVGAPMAGEVIRKKIPYWKIAIPVAIVLILAAGYYAYSSGLFSVAT